MDIFGRSGDIRDQSLKWSKIDRNFACFWPPFFFLGGGEAPEFLEWDYKTRADSAHVAKFQGDRSLEGPRRTSGEKNISPSGTTVPGGLTSPSEKSI